MGQQLRENAITLLATQLVDMKTVATPVLYTVPAGFSLHVVLVTIGDPTASLAGGVDYDLGDKVGANFFKSTVDLSGMTGTTDYYIVGADNAVLAKLIAGVDFVIDVITGVR